MTEEKMLRIFRLLLDVASGKVWNTGELAREYGVSKRTLQRDVRELDRLELRIDRVGSGLRIHPSARGRLRKWMELDTEIS